MTTDTNVTNAKRAAWAEAAIHLFTQLTGSDREDALCDLLGDLFHWGVQNRFDLSAALERALGHFEAELVEEGHLPAAPKARDGRGRLEHAAQPLLGTIFHLLPVQDPDPAPTPGPWEYNQVGLVYGTGPGDADGAPFVCDVARDCSSGLSPQERANARLIATAPDLLAGLESAMEAVEYHHEHEGCECTLAELRALIAKAKGGVQ